MPALWQAALHAPLRTTAIPLGCPPGTGNPGRGVAVLAPPPAPCAPRAPVASAASGSAIADTAGPSSRRRPSSARHPQRLDGAGGLGAAAAPRGSGPVLLVVESPAKATKIQKFLGTGYEVIASYGHVRDLPPKGGSIQPDQGFAMTWQLSARGAQQMAAIEEAARRCSRLVLATDPDREGEAISWHVTEELLRRGALPPDLPTDRITFTEVTPAAVKAALARPRQVSQPLVAAYLARRGLDYLVGFGLSPLLWRKLRGARSAGRVQSVALRLVCEREEAVEAFRPLAYFSVDAQFQASGSAGDGPAAGPSFAARLVQLDGTKVGRMGITGEAQAQDIQRRVQGASRFEVAAVVRSAGSRNPPPPLITSTLQQEASRQLGWAASRTMRAAQQLYEGDNAGEGLITYIRTDGAVLGPEAVEALRRVVRERCGEEYLPPQPRVFKGRVKNAQEAHEAIRPTDPALAPDALPAALSADQRALYALIWARSVACQMSSARTETVSVDVADGERSLVLRATATCVTFPGFLAIASPAGSSSDEGGQGAEAADEEAEQGSGDASSAADAAALSALQHNDALALVQVSAAAHTTRPPGRYTEGALVKALEEAGVGRPSTYAPVLKLLQDRGYVTRQGRALCPTSLGRVLNAFLQAYFPSLVDVSFTCELEDRLDAVAGGATDWRQLLDSFYGPFSATVSEVAGVAVTDVVDALDRALESFLFPPTLDGSDPRACPLCGGRLVYKPNQGTGGFIGCSNFHDTGCKYARPLGTEEDADSSDGESEEGSAPYAGALERLLGACPDSGVPVLAKRGPYGVYVQLGEAVPNGPKPPRSPAPSGAGLRDLTLQAALALLRPQRPLGSHPDDGAPVSSGQGRFGPYVRHHNLYAVVPKAMDAGAVDLDAAVALLAAKAQRVRARGRDPYAPTATANGKGKARSPAKAGRSNKMATPASSPAPKRPPTGYLLFGQAERQAIQVTHPSAKPKEMMGLVAAAWRALSEEQREQWNERARTTAAAAPSPGDCTPGAGTHPPASGAAGQQARRARGGSSAGGAGKRGRATRAPLGAKRPLNGYQLFAKHSRAGVLAAHPGAKPKEVMTLVAAEWAALGDEGKQQWQQRAKQDQG